MVDDGIEGRSLGEAEVEGSRSCGTFVRRNNESGGYDNLGGHQFVVHGLYRRCTVLSVEVLKTSRCARRREQKSADKINRWPLIKLITKRAFSQCMRFVFCACSLRCIGAWAKCMHVWCSCMAAAMLASTSAGWIVHVCAYASVKCQGPEQGAKRCVASEDSNGRVTPRQLAQAQTVPVVAREPAAGRARRRTDDV